jgi:hypothetical protein
LHYQAALRFGLASSVVSAVVLGRENDDVAPMVAKERNAAFWAGAEIGIWYSIGYLAQAEGLQTVAAGKVGIRPFMSSSLFSMHLCFLIDSF